MTDAIVVNQLANGWWGYVRCGYARLWTGPHPTEAVARAEAERELRDLRNDLEAMEASACL